MKIDRYSSNILEIWFLPKLTSLQREIISFVVPTAFPTLSLIISELSPLLFKTSPRYLNCVTTFRSSPLTQTVFEKSKLLIFKILHFSAANVRRLRSCMPTIILLLFAAFSDPLFRSAISSTNSRALIATVPMTYPWPSAQLSSREQLFNTGPKTVPCLTMLFIWNGSVFPTGVLTVIIAFLFSWNTKYKMSSLTPHLDKQLMQSSNHKLSKHFSIS